MPVKSLRGTVMTASNVPLLTQVSVRGANNYTIGTNMLSWDETNVYMMSQIASDFGQAVANGGPDQMRFKCGRADIGVFDFGLLFSCFLAISTAYAESGIGLSTSQEATNIPGLSVVWFGNYGIVYGRQHNLIIPLRSADIQRACKYEDVWSENFTDVRKFAVRREGLNLILMTEQEEQLCFIHIPVGIQKAYPSLFSGEDAVVGENMSSAWDERSQLGSLIHSSVNLTDAEATVNRYKENAVLDSVVVRDDLMCTPTTRYNNTQELFGSIAYTDKGVIALAVNFRNNLFVYQPWYGSEDAESSGILVDSSPKFQEFFNVTEECQRIARYADTVTVVPLGAAEFDVCVFEKVKEAFYEMRLPRVQFASAFGKVVIPEPVLVSSLTSQSGESVYCIVPVGTIGTHIVCKDTQGRLSTIEMHQNSDGDWTPWGIDTAFYDITGVI